MELRGSLPHSRVPKPWLSVSTFCNKRLFLRSGVVSTSPNPQAGVPPLVGCLLLLIQYIHSYTPYWRSFLHAQSEDMPCLGDRDPFISVWCWPLSYCIWEALQRKQWTPFIQLFMWLATLYFIFLLCNHNLHWPLRGYYCTSFHSLLPVLTPCLSKKSRLVSYGGSSSLISI